METIRPMNRSFPQKIWAAFTLRRLMILMAYLAILVEFIIPVLAHTGHKDIRSATIPLLLISSPVLAFLVMIFERTGPLKNWCVSFLNFLFFPALVLNHDAIVMLDYFRQGRSPALVPTLIVNGLLLPYVYVYGRRLAPRRCPGCRRWSLVRLMKLFKSDERTSKTYWCAVCGGRFWKDSEGQWRIDRRKTWVDDLDRAEAAGRPAAPDGTRPISNCPHRPPGGEPEKSTRPDLAPERTLGA
jgi:hypothetical protein